MKTHENSATEWRALLAKKEEEINALHRQLEWLTQQLRLTRGQRFGMSSEQTRLLVDSDQLSLFNEAEAEADGAAPEPEVAEITYRRRKQQGKRELDFSGLPVEQIVHELPDTEQVCPECGRSLHTCGHKTLRRELCYLPAQYKVVEHVQTVYGWPPLREKRRDGASDEKPGPLPCDSR